MTLLKMGIAIVMVLFLSVLAEVASPRFAGIFSGYPLGAAINLFFIGIEISPEFASESALYTALGLIATQVFAYGYLQFSARARSPNGVGPTAAASLVGIAGYFASAAILRTIPASLATAVLFPILSILAFNHLFRGVKNLRIQNRVGLSSRVLLFRSAFAAGAIVLVTSTARIAGPRWAGLFSAFPITMLPFVAIIHLTYGAAYAHTVLKNVPKGLTSLVVYSVAVSVSYKSLGVYAGTAVAYGLATLCLVAMQLHACRLIEAASHEGRQAP